MTCPKCKTAVPENASFCSSCGTEVKPNGVGKRPDEITHMWLRDVLSGDGYEVKELEEDKGLLAKHPTRPNIRVRINPKLNLITIQHFWSMKQPGWGGQKELLSVINAANSSSWIGTFAVDKDGDLNVSSYVPLATRLSEHDILGFLETESESFVRIVSHTDLKSYIK
jgi:Putative bacterial sensory transduction regulator/zinc-ribbon domain